MTRIKLLLAAASLTGEILFFVGLVFLVSDLFGLQYVITPEMAEDPSLLAPYIEETVISYGPVLGIGFLGAILNFTLITKGRYHSPWFLKGTRVLAWFWMPLIPFGTLFGVVLLGALRDALGSVPDT